MGCGLLTSAKRIMSFGCNVSIDTFVISISSPATIVGYMLLLITLATHVDPYGRAKSGVTEEVRSDFFIEILLYYSVIRI
jgi:hypothetical protein